MNLNQRDATPMRQFRREVAPEKPTSPYTAIPNNVTASRAYLNLSDAAVRLLLELARHHDGWNNGMLHVTYTALTARGMGSKSKIERAFSELVAAGLIVKARHGGLNAGPDCYALTWLPPSAKDRAGNLKDMPILPRPFPFNGFMLAATAPRERILKGAARKSRAAKVAREVHGDAATPGDQKPMQTLSTGNTVLFPPSGTVTGRNPEKTVPPCETGYPALRDGLSRRRGQSHPVQRDSGYRPLPYSTMLPRLITGLMNARAFGGSHAQ